MRSRYRRYWRHDLTLPLVRIVMQSDKGSSPRPFRASSVQLGRGAVQVQAQVQRRCAARRFSKHEQR